MTSTGTRNPQQLLLVKQLYEDGRLLASREDALSLAKAVVVLDLAIEQMLNTVIMDFTSVNTPRGKGGRKDLAWGDIWDRAAAPMKLKNHELMKSYTAACSSRGSKPRRTQWFCPKPIRGSKVYRTLGRNANGRLP